MSHYASIFFLGMSTNVRGAGSVYPALYVEPDGERRSGYVTFQLDSNLSIDEQLKIADRFALATAAWRDEIAAQAESERTATSELAKAHAGIERLKAEAGETE